MKYRIKGIGGRNKYKGDKPLPLALMKNNKYPIIKMWTVTDAEIIRLRNINPDGRTA